MTTRSIISSKPHIVAIWPDDGESVVEHALVLRRFDSGAIHIIQNGQCVYIPQYAIGPLMATLREMARAEKKEHAEWPRLNSSHNPPIKEPK